MKSLVVLALLLLLVGLPALPLSAQQPVAATGGQIFLLELPELGVAPTPQAAIEIPAPNTSLLLIHVLRPAADQIDYGQIFVFLNREAITTLSEGLASESGKLLRIRLNRRPGFALQPGRNVIEVTATNRLGRKFYSSFVIRTVTENRNQDFDYSVTFGSDARHQTPPELALLEPQSRIYRKPGAGAQSVRITGIATATTSIARVTVNEQVMALRRESAVQLPRLGLANEENRVAFDTRLMVAADSPPIRVEAVDAVGNRTRLQIPVNAATEAPATEFRGKKYALLIGISNFRYSDDRLRNLQYADADARAIEQFLRSPAGGRFAPENTLLLVNEQATLHQVKEALTNFTSRPQADDLLFIFFASHGAPDLSPEQKLFFFTYDTRVERLAETALAMSHFQALIEQHVRARRLVIVVDTCHSAGLSGEAVGTRGQRNNLSNLYIEKLLYKEEGKAVLTSSDVNELAQEGQRWGGGHGVFTYFLLEGLRGKADSNADRLIVVGELFRFVRQKVRLDTQFRQNPRMLVGANEDLVLAGVFGRATNR